MHSRINSSVVDTYSKVCVVFGRSIEISDVLPLIVPQWWIMNKRSAKVQSSVRGCVCLI